MDSSEQSMMSTEEPIQVTYNKSADVFNMNDHVDGPKCAFVVSGEELVRFRNKIREIIEDHSNKTTLNTLRQQNKNVIKEKLVLLQNAITENISKLDENDYDGSNLLDNDYALYQKELNNFKNIYSTYRKEYLELHSLKSPIMGRFVDGLEDANNTRERASFPKTDKLTIINLLENKVHVTYKKNPTDKNEGHAIIDIHDVCTQSTQEARLGPEIIHEEAIIPDNVTLPQEGGAKKKGKIRSRRHKRFNLSETSSDHGICE